MLQHCQMCFGPESADIRRERIFRTGDSARFGPRVADTYHLIWSRSPKTIHSSRRAPQDAWSGIPSRGGGGGPPYRALGTSDVTVW